MPNIRQYDAGDLVIRPEEKGYAAFEVAGRRIGPLYSQQAQDIKAAGLLSAQEIEDQKWALNFKALQLASDREREQAASRGGGGGGVRIANHGRATDDFPNPRMPNLAALNELSQGAVGLSGIAAGLSGGGYGHGNRTDSDGEGGSLVGPRGKGRYRNSYYDPNAVADPRTTYTLSGGRFVRSDKDPIGGYQDGDPNAGARKWADQGTPNQPVWNGSDYYSNVGPDYGGPNPPEVIPGGGDYGGGGGSPWSGWIPNFNDSAPASDQ